MVRNCQVGNIIYSSSGRYSSNITVCSYPSTEEEIVSLIELANNNNASIRVVGKSCSLSAVTMMDNTFYDNLYLLNLSANMTRVIDVNIENMTMTFEAGLSVFSVATELEKYNLSISEFGGPLRVNFVGSAMTGTHSWGTIANQVGTIASNIISLRLIIANGTIINANNTFNKDIFDAARVSFGTFGIISQITIQAKPIYRITKYPELFIYNLTSLQSMIDVLNDNQYLYYNLSGSESGFNIFDGFFSSSRIMNVNINDNQSDIIYNNSCWDTNTLPCTDVYYKTRSPPNMNRVALLEAHDATFFVDQSVWLDTYIGVLRWIINENKLKNSDLWNKTYKNYIQFGHSIVVNTRSVKQDDIWLSPAYKKNITQITFFYIFGEERVNADLLFEEWVYGIFNVLKEFENEIRFHWGKFTFASYVDLKQSYPMLDEFISLQKELDPNKIFVNKFIMDKLGLCHDTEKCCCTQYTCSVKEKCDYNVENKNNYWIWIIVSVSSFIIILVVLFVIIKRTKEKTEKMRATNAVKYMTMTNNNK